MPRNDTGHHAAHELAYSPQELTSDLVQKTTTAGRRFWTVVGVLAILFLAGVGGFAYRAAKDGFHDRLPWGYYAATFSLLLTAAGAAPIAAVATRMVKGHWQRPFTRAAELHAVVGIMTLLIFLPMLALLPPLKGRKTVWFDWPETTPQIYDSLSVAFLVLLGLALLYVSSVPDFAALRDHASGRRRSLWARLALAWQGTPRQWKLLLSTLSLLGGLYFMFFVFVQSMVSVDFSMSLVPGWKDAIYPAFQALSSLQAGVALLIVTLFVLRLAGCERYLGVDQFWGLAKLLLPLSLLWAYFWWSGFITYWYGRSPAERSVLELLMFGPYRGAFILAMLFRFGVPLVFLIWNPIRKSILGPTVVAAFVLVGTLFDRIRLYVSSFSIEDSTGHALESVPGTHYPDGADVLMMIGGVAGAIMLYLLATKVVPVVSLWEMKEGFSLRKVRRFLRREVVVLGKPE